jgi:hypothetical protein
LIFFIYLDSQMIPTEKEENVEIIYEKGSYSGMLNALNPNPIPGGIIERRKKFIFYFPDKKNATEIKNENLKKEKEKKELEKLGIGDWGLGIGDWGLGPIPNPQSPIPPKVMAYFILKN